MDERWQEIERIYHAAQELDGSASAGQMLVAVPSGVALAVVPGRV